VIDPHFVTFSSSLYTTISIPSPNANPNTNPNLIPNPNPNHNPYPNPNSNPHPNPNRNPTVITDPLPQTDPIDPQIVTIQIRLTDPPRSAFFRGPSLSALWRVCNQQQQQQQQNHRNYFELLSGKLTNTFTFSL